MNAKQVIGTFFSAIYRLVITVIMILVVYRVAIFAYNFGYMIFADVPKDLLPGTTKYVTIPENSKQWDTAKTLEENGIIEDAKVFFVQLILSDYKDEVKAGVYELNSSMHSEEIMVVIADVAVDEEQE